MSTDASCSLATDPANGNTHAAITGTWTGGSIPLSRVLSFTGPTNVVITLGVAKGGSIVGVETVEGSQLVATFYPS